MAGRALRVPTRDADNACARPNRQNEAPQGERAMRRSLRVLLEGVIDYAGLFPPAKLPLDQALRNYARYRHEPEGWMLGRFVCPASRLVELVPFHEELFAAGPPFVFSV